MKQLLEIPHLLYYVSTDLESIGTALAYLGNLVEKFTVLFCVFYLGDCFDLLDDVGFFVVVQIGLYYLF